MNKQASFYLSSTYRSPNAQNALLSVLGDKFGKSLGGSQAPLSFWKVPGHPRKFPELPQKFRATSPEVLSLWN